MAEIKAIINTILNVRTEDRFILGVDGLSRAGKTQFVNRVKHLMAEKDIPVCVFHLDDYIVEREKRYNTEYDEWFEYYQLQWDVKWLKDHFFSQIKKRKKLKLPIYDEQMDTHSLEEICFPDDCFIIVEGVFLQRREWRDFYDYVLYIDASREKRFSRETIDTQKKRDKFKNRYWKAEDYYLETENPKEQADAVFENECFHLYMK